MSKRTAFGDDLEKLASYIVSELISAGSGMSLSQRIDGFKALTTYWATAERVAAKTPVEDDNNAISFQTWRDKIKGAENG